MTDNYYMNDLIGSLKKDVVMERYYPLIDYKENLISLLSESGIIRRDQISDAVIDHIRAKTGDDIARLFARFIHIYDFNKSKLRDIKSYIGTDSYEILEGLVRLPGVRLLRAELYLRSGITLKTLAEKSTEEIRDMVSSYIQRENRPEIVPLPKEVNCHREVAKMILHADSELKNP